MSQCGVVPPGGVSETGNGVPLRGSLTVSGASDWATAGTAHGGCRPAVCRLRAGLDSSA